MKEIILFNGMVSFIDDEDFERVSQIKWYYDNSKGIATSSKGVKMHRFILGLTDPKIKVDHKNHNGLDNTRSNLRACTSQQNSSNKQKTKGTSKYKGVSIFRRRMVWQAHIMVNYKSIFLGYFDDEAEAAKVYNTAAIKHFGEFAKLNVMEISVDKFMHFMV